MDYKKKELDIEGTWIGIRESDTPDLAKFAASFRQDAAILELKPNSTGNITSLNLSRIPPLPGSSTFLIGSPSGLPLKYVMGGKVQKQLDTTREKERINTPTFCADVDLFNGNSGSPLQIEKNGEVVGIAQSILPLLLGSFGSIDQYEGSKLTRGVTTWVEERKLTQNMEQLVKDSKTGRPVKTANGYKLCPIVGGTFLHSFSSTIVSNDLKEVSWQRYLPDSPAIRIRNQFGRVDGLSYLATKRAELSKKVQGLPVVTVSLVILVTMADEGNNLPDGIGLKIITRDRYVVTLKEQKLY
jgi:hypothetical protein